MTIWLIVEYLVCGFGIDSHNLLPYFPCDSNLRSGPYVLHVGRLPAAIWKCGLVLFKHFSLLLRDAPPFF